MLTQQEAETLLRLEKYDFNDTRHAFPRFGGSLRLELYSKDKSEIFNLDITRGTIALEKVTFQTRARATIILVRLDTSGAPHRNPDGEKIDCPHIHIYKEGYGDKWAYPLPKELQAVLHNPYELLDKFMDYCNIIGKPKIHQELFI